MGFKDKFSSFFALDDEEMDYYEENEPSSTQPSAAQTRTQTSKPVVRKEQTIQPKTNPSVGKSRETNVVALNQQAGKKPRIKVVEPRVYSEVQEIADLLLANQSVVLNFRRSEKEQAKKMIDFLMGTVYAINGDIQRIGAEIFLCTPPSVEIDGAELMSMSQYDL